MPLDAGGGDSVLVDVIRGEEGPDVGILPLDGAAPAELLLGDVAPAEWSALGCATRGRARPLTGHGPSSTAEVVVLVPRMGEIVGRMRHGGQVHTDPPEYSLTLDCLQRALRLPTAPPQVPSTHWLAAAWLEAVLRSPDPGETAAGLDAGMEWGSLDWDRIRALVASGRWPDPAIAPEDASGSTRAASPGGSSPAGLQWRRSSVRWPPPSDSQRPAAAPACWPTWAST